MSKLKRAQAALIAAAEALEHYEESEFSDPSDAIEIAINEVESALYVEFRGE